MGRPRKSKHKKGGDNVGRKETSLILQGVDIFGMSFPVRLDDYELMPFLAADFVLNNECVNEYVESNKEMNELFHRFIEADRPKMKDKLTLYLFLSKCPCVIEDEEDELFWSNEEDKCYTIRFLRVCERRDIVLEEKLYVWNSATDEYTEVWQEVKDYKSNGLKP